jgi:signal transduction histidine kinase
MLSSGTRMSRLIEDMLDLTRARLAGGIPVQRTRVDLGPVIQRVVQEHQAACPDRRIEMLSDGDFIGDWDRDRLGQVASNLVGNALQHGETGEPIHVRLDGTDPDTLVLSVANAGRIAPDMLPHLFDPFRAGPHGAAPPGGLGLGLYIAQQIVCAHDGSVDVESSNGSRTVFRVTVPRRSRRG